MTKQCVDRKTNSLLNQLLRYDPTCQEDSRIGHVLFRQKRRCHTDPIMEVTDSLRAKREEHTTSSDITRRLNSSAMAAMDSSSCLVKTFPTGLWGVLTTIILVRGVIARLS